MPAETVGALVLVEQWEKYGLVNRAFMNSLLSEGVWSLYKMSVPC